MFSTKIILVKHFTGFFMKLRALALVSNPGSTSGGWAVAKLGERCGTGAGCGSQPVIVKQPAKRPPKHHNRRSTTDAPFIHPSCLDRHWLSLGALGDTQQKQLLVKIRGGQVLNHGCFSPVYIIFLVYQLYLVCLVKTARVYGMVQATNQLGLAVGNGNGLVHDGC